MELTKSILRKRRTKLLIFFVIIATSFSYFLLAPQNIGDWYAQNSQHDPYYKKSIYWYELSYRLYNKQDSLKKLCNQLFVAQDYEMQVQYYPELLENKDILTSQEYANILEWYISALYLTGNVNEYQQKYIDSLDDLKGWMQTVYPLFVIIDDATASKEIVNWALELNKKMLELNDLPVIRKSLYNQQYDLYIRLGLNEEALMAKENAGKIIRP